MGNSTAQTSSLHISHDIVNGEHAEGIEMRHGQQSDVTHRTSGAQTHGERGVANLTFRVCGLLLAIIYLALFIRYHVVFHNLIIVAYIASVWCIVTDTGQIYTLCRTCTTRLPASTLITLDIFGFLLIGPFMLANFFLRPGGISIVPGDGPDVHKPLPRLESDAEISWSLSCLGITAVISLVMMIVVCCVCCQDRRRASASAHPPKFNHQFIVYYRLQSPTM
ncbi:hypothetical protein VTL71DRAFT_13227 [Oculimacula yallundae]|uniref:Uncharacterized protein n=1 Tax=Oculimacula yallundae TaxID=86028 RepID=A0ABR4CLW1_9HELO